MTEEEFLTLALPDRIKWLHSEQGPRGKMSHDRFAKELGTSRQVVILWEKTNGPEPAVRHRAALAAFSGFSEDAFSRREAESATWASLGSRLAAVEAAVDDQGGEVARSLRTLARAIDGLERYLRLLVQDDRPPEAGEAQALLQKNRKRARRALDQAEALRDQPLRETDRSPGG